MGKIIDWLSSFLGLNSFSDDMFSAFVSTVLALFISWVFYHMSNRNAFKQDILAPIENSLREGMSEERLLEQIKDKTKLFSYRYAKQSEKEKLNYLEKACAAKKANPYEECFSEAIWDYFYKMVGEQRIYCNENEYGELNYGLCYPEENQFDLKMYAGVYDNEGNLLGQDDIKQTLSAFYELVIKGKKDINNLLKDVDVDKVVNESDYYKKYKEAYENFEKAKNKILV